MPSSPQPSPSPRHERPLGVIEALTAVRDQCPHAAVRDHAARALETIGQDGAPELRQQAFLVLSTIAGWRGERALAVKRALRAFVERGSGSPGAHGGGA